MDLEAPKRSDHPVAFMALSTILLNEWYQTLINVLVSYSGPGCCVSLGHTLCEWC